MATITFNLRNNQMTDLINVNVIDQSTNQKVGSFVLNRDECAEVQIYADSWGKGKAAWEFWTVDGNINSNKYQDNISEGDTCTLG